MIFKEEIHNTCRSVLCTEFTSCLLRYSVWLEFFIQKSGFPIDTPLQTSTSNYGQLTKIWQLFTFQQLPDGFSLHLANQDARTIRGGVVNFRKANMALDNSALLSSCISIGQFKRKPPESCLKDVSKLSNTNKNFVGWPQLHAHVCNYIKSP